MRKVLYYLIQLLSLFFLVKSIISQDIFSAFQSTFQIIALYYTYTFINKVLDGHGSDELNSDEKKTVLLTTFFNPLVAGAFYYYCLKKQFPKKASQANKWSWVMFGLFLIVIISIALIVPKHK